MKCNYCQGRDLILSCRFLLTNNCLSTAYFLNKQITADTFSTCLYWLSRTVTNYVLLNLQVETWGLFQKRTLDQCWLPVSDFIHLHLLDNNCSSVQWIGTASIAQLVESPLWVSAGGPRFDHRYRVIPKT